MAISYQFGIAFRRKLSFFSPAEYYFTGYAICDENVLTVKQRIEMNTKNHFKKYQLKELFTTSFKRVLGIDSKTDNVFYMGPESSGYNVNNDRIQKNRDALEFARFLKELSNGKIQAEFLLTGGKHSHAPKEGYSIKFDLIEYGSKGVLVIDGKGTSLKEDEIAILPDFMIECLS